MTPHEAAHAFLPAWTSPAALLFWGVWSFLFALAVTWLATLLPLVALQRRQGAHWTERARLAHPLKQALAISLVTPLLMAALEVGRVAGPFSAPRIALVAAVMAGSLGGWLLAAAGTGDLLRGERSPRREWLRDGSTGVLLVRPHVLWLALLAAFIPTRMGPAALAVLGIAALGFALLSWQSGLGILKLLGRVRPASDRLRAAAERAAASTGVHPAAVWEIPWSAANAFAYPWTREVAVTDGALHVLDDEELTTIVAHELAHLAEPRRIKLARASGLLVFLLMVAIPPVAGSWGINGLLALLVVTWGLVLALLAMNRRQEGKADAVARASEREAGREAASLEKLYQAQLLPVVQGVRYARSHPDLWDRMLASGVQPSYARPKPPRFRALFFVGVFGIIGLWIFLTPQVGAAARSLLRGEEDRIAFDVGVLGRTVQGFYELSQLRLKQGNIAEGADFYRLSFESSTRTVDSAVFLAQLEAMAGRCQDAKETLHMARSLDRTPGEDEPWWTSATQRVISVCQ
ncbi:MAG TPA: M48 family metalloprotease [Thermoanaerobaculia bacterium]|nr:M48 family metalloprotease [Thermoanaerobaculia bacterium]